MSQQFEVKAYGTPLNGPKIGDLVLCPEIEGGTGEYVGLVTGIAGYKLTVLGGGAQGVRDWDGTVGRTTWSMWDVHLIIKEGI